MTGVRGVEGDGAAEDVGAMGQGVDGDVGDANVGVGEARGQLRGRGGQARQRNAAAAKSKSRGGGRRNLRRSLSAPSLQREVNDEDVFFYDDDEPDIGKTLHAKDGKVNILNVNLEQTNYIKF